MRGPERFNASEHFLDRHVLAGRGGALAVTGPQGSLTYGELLDRAARLAGGLRQQGLRRGDRVVMVCSDGPDLLAALLACWRAGLVAVPVSTMLTGPELAEIVADSAARALVATPEFAAAAQVAVARAPDLELVLPVAGADVGGPRVLAFEDLPADPLPAVATLADEPALWLYTSGTTGSPKGAMHRHANLRAVCDTYARHVLRTTPADRFLSIAKLFFAYGLGASALFPLDAGATAVLEPRRPTPAVALERLRQDAPTLFFASPTFYAALLAADLPEDAFSCVRLCASAGEALPAALHRRFTERFGVELLDGLGSTEALHIFLSNRPGMVRPGTSGLPVPGYDLELRDDSGALVGDDVPGSLYVRGASMASGYWCRSDATRAVFQGEWLRTGDTYARSPDGWWTCLGRSGDLLKAGGIWVSPAEVEGRLLEHPAVAEAVVVGVPDGDELDKPVACVVLRPGATATEDELVHWCRAGLAAFKRPRAVLVLPELPKTATGKVQRFRLREAARTSPPIPLQPVPAGGAP